MADEFVPLPAAKAPSIPPPVPVKPLARWIAESLVDLAAVVVVGALAYAGRVDGSVAMVVVALIAGVRLSDLVSVKGGGPPAGGGAAAVLALFQTLFSHRS